MADWKVSREQIKLSPHPDPAVERLEIGALGQYQVVVQKGLYKDGDSVIFVPHGSILPDKIADKGDMRKYLVGPMKNRVKSIKLRQEISEGMVLPDQEELKDFSFGEDISIKLDIIKYEPPIPAHLSGKVANIDKEKGEYYGQFHNHDVEQFLINQSEFVVGEDVLVTEKIHGSQIIITVIPSENKKLVSSKGLFKRGLVIQEDNSNAYWKAAKNTKIFERIINNYANNKIIQVFGEIFPCQSGFSYGQTDISLRIFRVEVDNINLPYKDVALDLTSLWVPHIYYGPYNKDTVFSTREGSETVSGKGLHIREGVVISPVVPRKSVKGNFDLYLKIINPKYKETGEEIN